MISDHIREEFEAYAREQFPTEACALVVGDRIKLCTNVSHDPLNSFEISAHEYAKAEELGEIVAVIHSHPTTTAAASMADLKSCEASGLPWLIFGVSCNEWSSIAPTGYKAPLLGRPYCYGVFDCWELVRDYYIQVLNISLPPLKAKYGFWNRGENVFLDSIDAAGFYEVPLSEIREHDLILFQIRAPVINHIGVYLGSERFLHHLNKNLSARDIFGGFWFKNTVKAIRYKGVLCEANPVIW